MGKYILVGADPSKSDSSHPGGVLTLSIGLLSHAKKHKHIIEVINTLRSGFVEISIWRRLFTGGARAVELFRMLKREKFNGVIIFSGANFSFYERILLSSICRYFGVKDIFLIVDGWFFKIRQANYLKRYWVGMLLRIPNKLAASGGRWAELFHDLGVKSDRVTKISYWLPETFVISKNKKSVSQDQDIRFVYVGWMIREKGIYELLAAIKELRSTKRFLFTFIGGGTLLELVREKISEEKWDKEISAVGWVSDEEFMKHLSSADVFVLPSYAEGFPMSLIEAFTLGLPAICSDVGGISDSLHDGVNGFLIPPRQVQPLIEAMQRYLENPNIIIEQSRATLEIVKTNHNAEVNCELIFDALR